MEQTMRKSQSGGLVLQYKHQSKVLGGVEMSFSMFVPPAALRKDSKTPSPVLYWLSGLTCTHENFLRKAGAQRIAAELGIVLVMPQTSPPMLNIEGEADSWDFGFKAGFYLNATEPKWAKNYNMYDYVMKELPAAVSQRFHLIDNSRKSIFGHSMGGHGALVCFLKNPGTFKSVSAFAPVCNPSNPECAWGQKAFTNYLGAKDKDAWKAWDATELAKGYQGAETEILIDQGTDDGFLPQKQLHPERFDAACQSNPKTRCTLRMQEGYDHSYFFISTFVGDHIRFHAQRLFASI